jgi:hypothetical protein
MAFHAACARVATCRATQALSSSRVAPAQASVRAGFRRAHPFTGLRVRLLGPGVSLGLHSAKIEALRGEFTGAVMMRATTAWRRRSRRTAWHSAVWARRGSREPASVRRD